MSHLITSPDHLGIDPDLAISAENATVAISGLSGRISGNPVRFAWRRRAAWQGYARAMQLQGIEIDEVDVFSWGCSLPLPSRPNRVTVVDEFESFPSWWERLHERDQAGWKDRLPFTPEMPRDLPRLFQAFGIQRQYAMRVQGIEAWLALPIVLHRLGLTLSPLPCLVAGSKSFRFPGGPPIETVRATCRALAQSAHRGAAMLDDLEYAHRAALRAISQEYRAGKLPDLLSLSLHLGVLSPARVAAELKLSVAGAGKLLDRAAELDLLIEISGRRSWKIYATRDLAVAFGFRKPVQGRPKREAPYAIFDRALSETLDLFDRAMADVDAKLSRLPSGSAESA